jgi:hypothetical protein
MVLGVKAFIDRGISKTGSCSFALFTFFLFLLKVLEGFERPLGNQVVLLLLK